MLLADARGVVLLLAMVAVAACAPDSPPAEEPTPVPGTPPPPPQTGEVLLTEADDGARITVGPDAVVRLRLDSAYVWEEPRLEGDSVELVPVDYIQDPGFREWELHPRAPGTTVVAAAGDCAPGADCPEDRLHVGFTVTIEG